MRSSKINQGLNQDGMNKNKLLLAIGNIIGVSVTFYRFVFDAAYSCMATQHDIYSSLVHPRVENTIGVRLLPIFITIRTTDRFL